MAHDRARAQLQDCMKDLQRFETIQEEAKRQELELDGLRAFKEAAQAGEDAKKKVVQLEIQLQAATAEHTRLQQLEEESRKTQEVARQTGVRLETQLDTIRDLQTERANLQVRMRALGASDEKRRELEQQLQRRDAALAAEQERVANLRRDMGNAQALQSELQTSREALQAATQRETRLQADVQGRDERVQQLGAEQARLAAELQAEKQHAVELAQRAQLADQLPGMQAAMRENEERRARLQADLDKCVEAGTQSAAEQARLKGALEGSQAAADAERQRLQQLQARVSEVAANTGRLLRKPALEFGDIPDGVKALIDREEAVLAHYDLEHPFALLGAEFADRAAKNAVHQSEATRVPLRMRRPQNFKGASEEDAVATAVRRHLAALVSKNGVEYLSQRAMEFSRKPEFLRTLNPDSVNK